MNKHGKHLVGRRCALVFHEEGIYVIDVEFSNEA
jgi:hypothetical protein